MIIFLLYLFSELKQIANIIFKIKKKQTTEEEKGNLSQFARHILTLRDKIKISENPRIKYEKFIKDKVFTLRDNKNNILPQESTTAELT